MRTLVIYVIAALAIWFAIRFTNHIERYESLHASGVPITAKVVSTTCGNHGSFTYEYIVENQRLVGYGESSEGGLSCEDLAPSRSIPVTYLRTSPTESVAGNVTDALSRERSFAAISALFLPAIILWLVRRRRAKDGIV